MNTYIPPHQQRVIDEHAQLNERVGKLTDFISSSPIFAQLPSDESYRLVRQLACMNEYLKILSERINAFKV